MGDFDIPDGMHFSGISMDQIKVGGGGRDAALSCLASAGCTGLGGWVAVAAWSGATAPPPCGFRGGRHDTCLRPCHPAGDAEAAHGCQR